MEFHFIVIFFVFELITASDPLEIETVNGKVRGIILQSSTNKYVNAWYGIPFAKPPIGKLRFQRPVPCDPWNGVLETTTKPNSCLQLPSLQPNLILSEDCLYLNVVTPRKFKGKLKVMVWIYGGGYFEGSSSLNIYDLKNLAAEENVIAVSFQYRISSLGFLYLGIPEAPGNVGFFDQLLALKWVKENIKNFGGDPDSTTLFGQSAGAASIGYHLLSPLSKNLFQRSILESGVPTAPWSQISQNLSMERALILAESLNCSHDIKQLTAIVECLQKIDGQLLIEKEWKIPVGLGDNPFHPVVDGLFVTDTPKKMLSTGNFRNKNILIGFNTDEAGLLFVISLAAFFPNMSRAFVTKPVMTQIVNVFLVNTFTKDAINSIILEYTKSISSDPTNNYRDALLRLASDYFFNCEINKWALRFSEDGSTVYKYLFTHHSLNSPYPSWVNSTHEDELPYVFGLPLNSTYGYTDDERQLTRTIMKYWTNFAKTGDPNGDEKGKCLNKWQKYNSKEQKYLELNLQNFEVEKGSITSKCKIWDKYL